jgi:hypothetical protein
MNFIEKMLDQGYTRLEIAKMEGVRRRDINKVKDA